MFYSDEVTILDRGPKIPAKLLQPIGILDGSICWGIKIPDLRDPEEKSAAHLLIAPLHPDSWPFIFRLRVSLRHSRGTFRDLSQILSTNHANILFCEGGPAGHHHASLNIIGEALDVKRRLIKRKERVITEVSRARLGLDKRYDFCNELAAQMLGFIRDLKRSILAAHNDMNWKDGNTDIGGAEYDKIVYSNDTVKERLKERGEDEITYAGLIPRDIGIPHDVGFLHHRIARGWSLLYDRSRLPDDVKEKEEPRQRISAVACRWLENLAFFSVYGESPGKPIRFKYNEMSSVLAVDRGKFAYEDLVHPFKPPTVAVASFDNVENYVRLRFLRGAGDRPALDRIVVPYRSDYNKTGRNSCGIMEALCKEISNRGVNLLRVTNVITSLGSSEEGRVLFIGEADQRADLAEGRRADLRAALSSLRCTNFPKGNEFTIRKVEVGPYRTKQVFVSLPLDPENTTVRPAERILDAIHNAGTIKGWKYVVARTRIKDVRYNVEETIQGCEGFLQVFYLKDGQELKEVDFAWLHYEFGLATAMGKPIVRTADTVSASPKDWQDKLTVDRGKALNFFNLNATDIVEQFCGYLQELEEASRSVQ